jgi:glycosyltransferase involved in cell wall biosynthesis
MKVCVVSLNLAAYFDPHPRSKYGGAEVQAAFVARALKEQGVDVHLVVADLPDGAHIPYPTGSAFGSAEGLPVLRFFHPRMTGISDALARANADIYYQRNAGMVTGLVAHHARRNRRLFVYGAGSDSDFSFRHLLIHGVRDRLLFMYGLRRAHGVVTQNSAQLATARDSLSVPVAAISNGVLPAESVTVNVNGPVLWAGGLRPVKRPNLFIELARRFPSREFVMVGGSTTTEVEYAAAAEREARTVSNLRLTGWLPHSDVIREISRASVIVNTSEYEGFPNVYLEAWNHGVPVVSFSDVDGLLARERLGALCSDLDDMEKKLRALIEDSDAMAAASERARRAVAERFSPHVLGPQYVSFFESLLAGRKSPQGAPSLASR